VDDLHDVFPDRRIDVNLVHQIPRSRHLIGRGHGFRLIGRGRGGHPVEDHQLLVLGRIADRDLEQKPVELRFRQLIGALLVDRVLRRQHQERLGQGIGTIAERDLPLLHCFEQSGLHLRGGAVDFVGENQIVENRPQLRLEFRFLRVVNHRPHQIGGQQIRRELETRERGVERPRKRLHRQGFRQTGHAFQQDVAVAQQPDEQPVHQPFLADEHLAHLLLHRVNPAACLLDSLLQIVRCHRFRPGVCHVSASMQPTKR